MGAPRVTGLLLFNSCIPTPFATVRPLAEFSAMTPGALELSEVAVSVIFILVEASQLRKILKVLFAAVLPTAVNSLRFTSPIGTVIDLFSTSQAAVETLPPPVTSILAIKRFICGDVSAFASVM